MAEAKVGNAFITHEFDEAIAVQGAIVEAETRLADSHPDAAARLVIRACLADDEGYLQRLQSLGTPRGAIGRQEEVAAALAALLESTVASASEAPSEAYEAHAVLLNAKRKQQDAAGGMKRIARALGDIEVHEAAQAFEMGQKAGSQMLADALAAFAVVLATSSDAEVPVMPNGNEAASVSTSARSTSGRKQSSRKARP